MKTLKFLFAAIVSAVVAAVVSLLVFAKCENEMAFIATFFCVGILVATLLGAFDMPFEEKQSKFDSIRHKHGVRRAA